VLIKSFKCVICDSVFERDRGNGGRPPQVCGKECGSRRAVLKSVKWQKANPERTVEIRKKAWAKYYDKNRQAMIDRAVQYSRDNGDWKRAQDSAYRAKRLGSPTAERFTLDEIYERDGHRCHLCKKLVKRNEATMDHIVPASLGGPHTRANVALAHRSCNASKGNRVVGEQLRIVG
jgi:5-methylcytosine-specific restriction endonuclease McrA